MALPLPDVITPDEPAEEQERSFPSATAFPPSAWPVHPSQLWHLWCWSCPPHLVICSGLQTVVRWLANKRRFELTFCANRGPRQPTFVANEPTFAANSLQ